MEKYDITEDTKIIGKSGNLLLITNDKTATLSDLFKKGVIIDKDNNKLSPELPIGVLTKMGGWKEFESKENINIARAALIGFAVGDAFGVPVEFLDRNTIRKINLKDMISGTHNVPAGSWSDDTSMIVASMVSMINNNGDINLKDFMDNFMDWLQNSKYTSIDKTFGVGGIIYDSLLRYHNGMPLSNCGGKQFMDNGNGSLMRILPVSLFCIFNNCDEIQTVNIINQASAITHAHDISKMGCYIYTEFLRKIVFDSSPQEAFYSIIKIDYSKYYSREALAAYSKLLNPEFLNIKDDNINESGYVVDTLEASIYSILNTETYEESIKCAVNLGYDTDTVAGITGSISAILYGENSIPKRWLTKLKKREQLEQLADKFMSSLHYDKQNKVL